MVGPDVEEKAAIAAELAATVDEGLEAFNVDRLRGGEMSMDDLLAAAETLPMMAARRVVIVHDAEQLLVPKRESRAADAEQERLEVFLSNPPPHATVVFVCGGLDLRRRSVKLLLKEAQVVECGLIEDAGAAERWVRARAAAAGVPIEPAATRLLVERAGLDIGRLRAAFERVSLYTMGQATVTVADVAQVVAAGPETQENFGIANAIGAGDARTALRELGLALEGGAAAPLVLGQIRFAAEKVPGPRLRAAIEAVLRTDLALKSSPGDPRVLLERLVVELCGRGSAPGPPGRAWPRRG